MNNRRCTAFTATSSLHDVLGLLSAAEEGLPAVHPAGRDFSKASHKESSTRSTFRLDFAYLGSAFQVRYASSAPGSFDYSTQTQKTLFPPKVSHTC